MARVEVMPIGDDDLPEVGAFLHRHLNDRISPDGWMAAAQVPWQVDAPNHGFRLLAEGDLVGVYLAFYSSRDIAGRIERFCNMGAWCVMPNHRLHSLLLLRAMLAQKGYHFTDLSPSGNTIPVNERLRFVHLDTRTALMPNLPWPICLGNGRVISDHAAIERILSGAELEIYRDHARAGAARHVVVTHGADHCYVIFRKDRRKGLPCFASVLYVSDRDVFIRVARRIGRYLLLHHAVAATLMELRVIGARPPGSFLLAASRPKMFRSDSLSPDQIDYLYSELACVPW